MVFGRARLIIDLYLNPTDLNHFSRSRRVQTIDQKLYKNIKILNVIKIFGIAMGIALGTNKRRTG